MSEDINYRSWKRLKGYEEFYVVSDQGDVYSLWYNRLLKPHVNKTNGYAYVSLRHKDKSKNKYCSVHRLIALTFVDNPNHYEFVNHKNEIKTDNRAENLEWCTKAYNNSYGSKLDSKRRPVVQMSTDGKEIATFKCASRAQEKTGVQYKNIHKVCKGERHTAGGYKWKYKEKI